MEVRLSMATLRLVCAVADVPRPQHTVIGVDLGVNTLLAATDGEKTLLVSGRAAKATVQYRNKRLAECSQAQSTTTKGSRQWTRVQRRKAKMLAKCHRRLRDLMHKATRKVATAFPRVPRVTWARHLMMPRKRSDAARRSRSVVPAMPG
jgi:transposase